MEHGQSNAKKSRKTGKKQEKKQKNKKITFVAGLAQVEGFPLPCTFVATEPVATDDVFVAVGAIVLQLDQQEIPFHVGHSCRLEKVRKGEREKVRKGKREKGEKGEKEKVRKGEREKGRK